MRVKAWLLLAIAITLIPWSGVLAFAASAEGSITHTESPVFVLSSDRSTASVHPSMSALMGDILALTDGGVSDVTVAVVDSGIDPVSVQPRRLVDWIDLTTEGTVRTSSPLPVVNGTAVSYAGKVFSVEGVKTRSGYVRMGFFGLASLDPGSPIRREFGVPGDVPVLVSDAYISGQYDTVYVDSDLDHEFGDETPLEVFRNSQATVSIFGGGQRPSLTLVVADIDDNGRLLRFGFDGHGHGTAIASVFAGRADGFTPLVPNGNLIGVKAFDSTGRASQDILADALLAGAKAGADVIVLSVEPSDTLGELGALEAVVRQLGTDYGILVVMAAGNSGPGLSTLSSLADLPNVLAVGGYIPGALGSLLNTRTTDTFWPWTSIGPTRNGKTISGLAPAVGAVISPSWSSGDRVYIMQGTSVAAAYGGVVAARLIAQSSKLRIPASPSTIKWAMEQGARLMAGYEAVEIGAGRFGESTSVAYLADAHSSARLRIVSRWADQYFDGGFFDRERLPGALRVLIDNLSPRVRSLDLLSPPWIRTTTSSVLIPPVDQHDTEIVFASTSTRSLQSDYVVADDKDTAGMDLRMLITVIRALEYADWGPRFSEQRILTGGSPRRDFLKVPDGIESLNIELRALLDQRGTPRGQVQLFLYDPSGRLVLRTGWIGRGAETSRASLAVGFPSAGTWEVVVIGDPLRPASDADPAYELTVSVSGIAGIAGGERVIAVPLEEGAQNMLSAEAKLTNLGAMFQYRALVLEPASGGTVVRQNLAAMPTRSLAKQLPEILTGTDYLYLCACSPDRSQVGANVFLYYLDPEAGQWVQVASSSPKHGSAEIMLKAPRPGRYVAYIEVPVSTVASVPLEWLCVVGRHSPAWSVTDSGNPAKGTWGSVQEKELRLTAGLAQPTSSHSDPEGSYLTIWDESSGALKAVLPIDIRSSKQQPVVFVGKGLSGNGTTALTIRAWQPISMRPVDAMVLVGDRWYQLDYGQTTLVLPQRYVDPLRVSVFAQGLLPITKLLP